MARDDPELVNHPNLLAVFDVGVQDGCAYLVSELIEGEGLRERLRRGPLPPRTAIAYGLQIAQGLAGATARSGLTPPACPSTVAA